MNVDPKDIIDTIDLYKGDAFLPLYECVVNSIISLMKVNRSNKKIEVIIKRESTDALTSTNSLFEKNVNPISEITIIDNGEGFNETNLKSFSAPFSRINRKYGCKGFGRFSMLAAFSRIEIFSVYTENGKMV